MDTSAKPPVFDFAGFRLDTGQRQLFGPDGQAIPLTGRVFETLLCLVKHQGTLLDKNVLMNTVWPNVVVEENNLNQTISALRKALGEGPGEHRFIVTVPGRGYQFIPSVQRLSDATPTVSDTTASRPPAVPPEVAVTPSIKTANKPPLWLGVGAAVVLLGIALYFALRPAPELSQPESASQEATATEALAAPLAPAVLPNSIAVLPFENFSPDPDDAYFAAGIHEEILNQLTNIQQMTVIAATTMRQYEGTAKAVPDIARELNVQTVMEGSIRYADSRVRITTQLIDAATGANLWSETYEREFDDIFAIESDIALNVATAMRTEFTAEEAAALTQAPTTSSEAYALYLAAHVDYRRGTAEGMMAAIEKIERVLVLDPGFVEAWIAKSDLYGTLPLYLPERTEENLAVAEQALRRAAELAPGSVLVLELSVVLLQTQGRWLEMEAEYRRVPASLRRGENYALYRLVTGFPEDSLEGFRYELQRDPLAAGAYTFFQTAQNALNDTTGAMATYESGAELFDDWFPGRVQAINTLLGMGAPAEAAQIAALGLNAPAEAPLLALLESPEQASDVLRALRDDPRYAEHRSQFLILLWAVYFDLSDLALETASSRIKAVPITVHALWTPLFTKLRQHPGFKTLVTEAGLVELWREYGWPEYCQPVGTDDFNCH